MSIETTEGNAFYELNPNINLFHLGFNVGNKSKYKKKFKEIYNLIESDDKLDKDNATFNLLILKYIDGVMLENYIIEYLNVIKTLDEAIDFFNTLYDKFFEMMKDIYKKLRKLHNKNSRKYGVREHGQPRLVR